MAHSLRHWLITGSLLGFAAASHATGNYFGTFRPYFFSNQLYIEETNVQKSSLPACVTRNLLRLSVDTTTPEFKEQYAMLLAAWYTGRTLNILGSGNCTSEGDEIILQIQPQ